MKYISDLTGKTYDSAEECTKADEAYEQEKKAKEEQKAKEQALISKEKKELADAVDAANKKIEDAYTGLEEAKKKAREILENSYKEAERIISEAKKPVTEAEKEKRDAMIAYNKKYGTYQRVYTGEEAEKEFARINKYFNDSIRSLFDGFWF